MTPDLTVLCVTRGEGYALPFLEDMQELAEDIGATLVVAADGNTAFNHLEGLNPIRVHSHGYIESVLDEALDHVATEYVLRLDDDERVSYGMYVWLLENHYRDADHWAFPRAHLWPDASRYVTSSPLWPDLQTRLSVKAKAGGRRVVHAGSPYGTGRVAPCVIEHHKFLVRPIEERRRLVERYEQIQTGAGREFLPFSMPELCDLRCEAYESVVEAA